MAKKLLKKIGKIAAAGMAAHALSKAGAKKPLNMKYFGGLKSGDANVAENLALWDKGMTKMGKGFDKGNVHQHTPWYKKWWNMKMKNSGGPIKAYQGQLVKSQTRGTGAAVKGTTHEVMPGMDAAKKGKMIKARHGTQVRTRGSNPDNPYVTQGGEVQIATKLNGVLKTRTW